MRSASVNVGCDHSAFTDDYAAVPVEMQQVAAETVERCVSPVRGRSGRL